MLARWFQRVTLLILDLLDLAQLNHVLKNRRLEELASVRHHQSFPEKNLRKTLERTLQIWESKIMISQR